jgi:hypothetical protein
MTALATNQPKPNRTGTQAQDLFSLGYRCSLTMDDCLLIVSPEEMRYRLTADRCCTCKAGLRGQPCKHSRNARALCLAQGEELWKEGAEWEMASIAEDHNPVTRRMARELIDAATRLNDWAMEVLKP